MRITRRCSLISLSAIVRPNRINPIMQRAKINRSVRRVLPAGADPGFLDRGFKLAEGVRFVQFCLIFPEIPHENEII